MRILDNLLSEDDFKPIQSYFLNKLPWTYLDHIVGNTGVEEENEDCYQFVHTFFSAKDPYLERKTSEHSHIIKPILFKLAPWLVLRVKGNLRPFTPEHVHSALHVDLKDVGQLTAIYYLNTCNGYTMFKDGTKVESVENRVLIFDGSELHCGASCTDEKARFVLNINYLPGTLDDGSKYIPDEKTCGLPTLLNFGKNV